MISIRNSVREARIRVARDIDDESLPELKTLLERVRGEASRRVVVDLSECDYITSSAIGALIQTDGALRDRFEIWVRPEGAVHRIFDICGLFTTDLSIHVVLPTVDEACGLAGGDSFHR